MIVETPYGEKEKMEMINTMKGKVYAQQPCCRNTDKVNKIGTATSKAAISLKT